MGLTCHSVKVVGDDVTAATRGARASCSSLLSKLNGRDRAQLVVIAYETGVATPGQNRPGPLRRAQVRFGQGTDQPLLHHRYHQLALGGEHLAAGQAPAAVGHG